MSYNRDWSNSVDNMMAPAYPRRRILVIDDEPFVCDAVKMMLEFDGHEVDTARGGEEALAILELKKFDIVMTDYLMPGMKGDELAVTIKRRFPGQPVVMITAHVDTLRSSEHPLTGIDFLIGKPFLLENLREAFDKVCPAGDQSPGSGQN
jgi:CheY-like chemotaxis protein